VSRLSRKCESPDVSQLYGPSLPVTRISLPFYPSACRHFHCKFARSAWHRPYKGKLVPTAVCFIFGCTQRACTEFHMESVPKVVGEVLVWFVSAQHNTYLITKLEFIHVYEREAHLRSNLYMNWKVHLRAWNKQRTYIMHSLNKAVEWISWKQWSCELVEVLNNWRMHTHSSRMIRNHVTTCNSVFRVSSCRVVWDLRSLPWNIHRRLFLVMKEIGTRICQT
jgi:hypothetical protein